MELVEGMLLTGESETYPINVVREAEKRIQEKKTAYGYQTSMVLSEFRTDSAKLMFGEDNLVLAEARNKECSDESGI